MIETKHSKYEVYSESSDTIKIRHSTNHGWRATLTDYKYTGERIEFPDGSVETGVVGTKMSYDTDISSSVLDDTLSEYIEIEP